MHKLQWAAGPCPVIVEALPPTPFSPETLSLPQAPNHPNRSYPLSKSSCSNQLPSLTLLQLFPFKLQASVGPAPSLRHRSREVWLGPNSSQPLFWSLCSLYLFLFSDFPPLYLFQFLDFCFVIYLFIFVGSLGIWLLGNITFQCLVLWFLVLLVFVWMSAVVLLCIYFFFILWSKPCFNFQCCFMIGMQTWDDNHSIGCSRSISMYLIEHKFGHLDVYQYIGTMKIIS